jgi:hypothetical protein
VVFCEILLYILWYIPIMQIENAHHTLIVYISFYGYMLCRCPNKQIILLKVRYMLTCASGYIVHVQYCSLPFNRPLPPKATPLIRYSTIHWDCEILLNFPLYPLKRGHPSYNMYIPVNLWELLGGRSPPTNSSKGKILCIAFKCTKLYLVVAYMW